MRHRNAFLVLVVAAVGCGGSSGSGDDDGSDTDDLPSDSDVASDPDPRPREQIEAELSAAIDGAVTDAPFTVLIGDANGTIYTHSHGESSATTVYESASTSKMVAGAVLMRLVEQGVLALDSHPQDFVDFWTDDPEDARSAVTLSQLLSFTSGMQGSGVQTCTNQPSDVFADCVEDMYDAGLASIPGEAFWYGSNHLQIAGLMAMRATNKTWQELFADFKTATGLFGVHEFDLPSLTNPRLAGGMHWTAIEYGDFLRALLTGTLLSDTTRAAMYTDHTPVDSVTILSTPAEGIGEAWHYGYAMWRECPFTTYDASCGTLKRVASPGAYGAYPFIDIEKNYYGILARQGALQTFPEGYNVYQGFAALVDELVLKVHAAQ